MTSLDKAIGSLVYHIWETKEGGRRLREFKRLKDAQYLNQQALKQLQSERLTALLRHAYKTSPWYQSIIGKSKIDLTTNIEPRDLKHLPVTTKSDIRNNTDRFISVEYDINTLNRAKTGGSTGVSLNIYFDERCQQWRNGAQMYADNLVGWEPGTRVASVWGNPPVPTTSKQKLRSYLLERTIYLDTMDLNQKSMNDFVEQCKSFGPEIIFGHAHSIYIFSKFLLENNIVDLRPRGVVATSMMLLDHERAVIERAFSAKVSNRYGCEEVGLIAVECEKHRGMHINSPHVVLECLDSNNDPVKQGESGKIVLTDLNNYAMPLIRYRVEDVGVLGGDQCECGRTLPILERLEGRVADFLKKPDGGQVAGVSLVERTLTKVSGVEQMQILQENLHEIKIRRVKGKDFSEQTDQELIAEFRRVFDESITLTIIDTDTIPQEASGKYRFSICKV